MSPFYRPIPIPYSSSNPSFSHSEYIPGPNPYISFQQQVPSSYQQYSYHHPSQSTYNTSQYDHDDSDDTFENMNWFDQEGDEENEEELENRE